MFRRLSKFWIVLVLALYCTALFYKVFLYHLWPFPGDVLVTYFYPWNSGGWAGWYEGIFHKEVIAADVFRMYIPWKSLGVELLRSGQLPLWNPYNFSGNPLLANFQSSLFYPLGVFFYFLPLLAAWLLYAFLQIPLGFFGMYLYLKRVTSREAALVGALAFVSTGFMLSWFDWGIVGHSAAWIGWLLFLSHMAFFEKKKTGLVFLPIIVAFSILAGYPQITLLAFIVTTAYSTAGIVKSDRQILKRSRRFVYLVGAFGFGLMLTAAQTIPTLEFWRLSARDVDNWTIISRFALKPVALVTIFAHDFFGNIAVGNFWGEHHYQEHMVYFGVAILPLVIFALYKVKSNFYVRFFLTTAFLSIVLILPTPLLHIFQIVPILSSGIPSRTLFLFQTSATILATLGLDRLLAEKTKAKKQLLVALAVLAAIYLVLWSVVTVSSQTTRDAQWWSNLDVAKHNLVLPTMIFLLSSVFLISFAFGLIKKWMLIGGLLILVTAEAGYFFNKFTPFSPAGYFFPEHPLLTELSQKGKVDRVWGYDSSAITPNFNTYFRFQTPSGYNPLYLKRYGELLASSEDGKLNRNLQRADADLPKKNTPQREKIAELLGISYYPNHLSEKQKGDDPAFADRITASFTPVRTDFWPIAQDPRAFSRAFLVGSYLTSTTDEGVIDRMFDPRVDLRHTVVLEQVLKQPLDPKTGTAEIVSYEPNKVVVETQSDGNNILFLSDNYYPGWNAYVDGVRSEVYRTDYTFRSVFVPQGSHRVIFQYQPRSFRIGLAVTLASLLGYFTLLAFLGFKKKSQ